MKDTNVCKHGIRKNSGYVCATCTFGSKYTSRKTRIRKENKMKVAIILSMMFVGVPLAMADDSCQDQCTGKYVNVDATIVCVQVCKMNETNQQIVAQLKEMNLQLEATKK